MWLYLLILIVLLYTALQFTKFTGVLGSNTVMRDLIRLNHNSYTIFHDLFIEHESGKVIRIDQLVVSNYGIFLIVAHQYRGIIGGTETSNYWNIRLFGKSKRIVNLLKQAKIQVKLIKGALDDSQLTVTPIVVLSGLVKLNIKTNAHVIHVSQFKAVMGTYKQIVLDDISKQRIANKLQEIKANKKASFCVYNVTAALEERKRLVTANICPKCGYALITQGKSGQRHKRCTQFKKCKFKTGL